MTRFRAILVVLLAPVLLLAACSDTVGSPAATVNGREISDADFRDLLGVLADNPEYAQALTNVPTSAAGEPAEGRVDSAFAAAALEFEILLTLVDDEATERGIEVTAEDLETTRGTFSEELQGFLDELPEDYVESFARWNTQVRLLQEEIGSEVEVEEVTDEQVQAFYDENPAAFETVCARHVLVETEAEANDVLADLEAGGDFAAIAGEVSIDPGSGAQGGDLGCGSAEQYVAPFAEAVSTGEIGEYLGPVQTDFGFHVILVESRDTTPFDEVSEQIRAQLEATGQQAQGAAFSEWLETTISEADISVGSRYGSWDAETGRVVPPEPPASGAATVSFE